MALVARSRWEEREERYQSTESSERTRFPARVEGFSSQRSMGRAGLVNRTTQDRESPRARYIRRDTAPIIMFKDRDSCRYEPTRCSAIAGGLQRGSRCGGNRGTMQSASQPAFLCWKGESWGRPGRHGRTMQMAEAIATSPPPAPSSQAKFTSTPLFHYHTSAFAPSSPSSHRAPNITAISSFCTFFHVRCSPLARRDPEASKPCSHVYFAALASAFRYVLRTRAVARSTTATGAGRPAASGSNKNVAVDGRTSEATLK